MQSFTLHVGGTKVENVLILILCFKSTQRNCHREYLGMSVGAMGLTRECFPLFLPYLFLFKAKRWKEDNPTWDLWNVLRQPILFLRPAWGMCLILNGRTDGRSAIRKRKHPSKPVQDKSAVFRPLQLDRLYPDGRNKPNKSKLIRELSPKSRKHKMRISSSEVETTTTRKHIISSED